MLGVPASDDVLQADVQIQHQLQLVLFLRCPLVVVVVEERYRHGVVLGFLNEGCR